MPLSATVSLWVRPIRMRRHAAPYVSDYALSMRYNSVHGSDSPASAAREIEFFFPEAEICPRPE